MYDLIILGGGPAGYLAAERAGAAGLVTLLIEKNKLGGVCLQEGCIPTKAFLHSAKLLDHAAHGARFGFSCDNPRLDQAVVTDRKNRIVRGLTGSIANTLKNCGASVRTGEATILGRSGDLFEVASGGETFTGRRLLIATGSRPIVPPIPGLAEALARGSAVTSREILDLTTTPESLAVIGGGIIGLEMAAYFQACGSHVSVIEMLDHIAGAADREMADALQRSLARKGISFNLGSRVSAVDDGSVEFTMGGETRRLQAALTLLSVGRQPAGHGLGLERIGVHSENGKIPTDRQCRTNVPDVYAAGDVNGIWMLAHAAYREAEVAVNMMLGRPDEMNYQAMPSVVYTDPELAFVGETEESCRAQGIAYSKTVLPLTYSGRYVAENERGDGQIKLLADPAGERLLGCHILGSYASEIIATAGILIASSMPLAAVQTFVFPHPTVGEILREAIRQLKPI